MTKPLTLTKADLIQEVERITELKRSDSETIVETIFDSIIESLQKGDKIEIRGFGSFRTRQRRGRVGRNPKTGAKVEVPPKKIPFFKPSKELKDFVNSVEAAASAGATPGERSLAAILQNRMVEDDSHSRLRLLLRSSLGLGHVPDNLRALW